MDFSKIKTLLAHGDLTFFASLAVVGILPVYIHYLPPFMILWVVLWLMQNKFRINKSMIVRNKAAILFFLFVGFFFWQISGLLFADSLNSGFERIFKRLSLLFFPLVLFYPGERISKDIKLIIRLFVICTLIYVTYCFVNAFHKSIVFQDWHVLFNPHPPDYDYENFFYSTRFSDTIHPTYLSMYVVLSLLISIESFFENSLSSLKRGLWLIAILLFSVSLYLLSSRAGLLSALVVFPSYLVFKLYRKLSFRILIIAISLMIIALIVVAKTNERINYSIEGISKGSFQSSIRRDERYLIWKSALGVIKQNFIIGVGTGDASQELKKEFKLRGYVAGYYDNLNAHNQFLEILLENGIVGLVIFLSLMGYMIFVAISEGNIIYGLFIIMMIIFFFFETFLNRLAGVTFFPLMTFLLINYKTDPELS